MKISVRIITSFDCGTGQVLNRNEYGLAAVAGHRPHRKKEDKGNEKADTGTAVHVPAADVGMRGEHETGEL